MEYTVINDNPKLEEVFKTNGVPFYTFVEPKKYPDILLSLRTPGRCLVIEGPSGIGKTTAIENALTKTGITKKTTKLSARTPADIEYINMLPDLPKAGIVIVDDFHRLPQSTKSSLADYLKVLADREDKDTKIVVLGINRAGDNLIEFSPDLINRIDIVRFETEPNEKILEMIVKGEAALNVKFNTIDDIVAAARGSFVLAQMLCREICSSSNVLEKTNEHKILDVSFESIRSNVWDRLSMVFRKRCEFFCRGTKLRKEGRAPYLHILNWLANGDTWTLDLRAAIRTNPGLRVSVGQVVDKSFLKNLIDSHDDIRQVLHYDERSALLTIEDPQFLFYVRYIPWRQFAQELGFLAIDFKRRYDFALSFAGSDRNLAEAFFKELTDNECTAPH